MYDVSSGLPKVLWGEAVMTASYIVNRTPLIVLDGKIPEQMWSRESPNYSLLRTFGCAAYSHQSVGKLEARAQKCVFLSYPDGVKGYRLWEKEEKEFKIITSRDVTFNEYNMPCIADKGSDESSSENSTRFHLETDFPSDLNQHQNAAASDVDSNEVDEGQPEREVITSFRC
ncbi:Integrase catalytic domain-containing protein [Abeliophyllum distichum]|uniref:Integrase catalytic domain-containing protein n=1 Tax=Abeliophyllum distichum TaxID=126358 RepID=A0ABD1PEF3_9LAMI